MKVAQRMEKIIYIMKTFKSQVHVFRYRKDGLMSLDILYNIFFSMSSVIVILLSHGSFFNLFYTDQEIIFFNILYFI